MYPSFAQIQSYAKDYRRVPLCTEIFADMYTPVQVLQILRNVSKHTYVLESASQDQQWGRYSFLGYDPTMEITCTDGNMHIRSLDGTIDEQFQTAHPKNELRKIMERYTSPKIEGLPPFSGGLVGYFSYDYIKYSEPKLKLHHHDTDFKDMDVMLFDSVICFDHYKQKIILMTGVFTSDLEASYSQAIQKLAAMKKVLKTGKKKQFAPIHLEEDIHGECTEREFEDMVNTAKHYIHEGDIFQVVLSNPMRSKATGSLFDTFRVLRTSNPSPYMFYFSSEDMEMAGASPETLAKLENDTLFTFPLAGTTTRGKTPAQDKAKERALLANEKERAEHNMLVDLGRNDIGRIAKIGSVSVDKYMAIERFSQVMHIGSTVTGTIRPDLDALDALDSILPAGTLSGAPKFRACEIIDELEHSKRGIYGGAIGYIDFTGNLDTCIAIRLVYKKDHEICIRSGAGIVADSIPENEYRECQNKAKAVVQAIQQAQEGFE